MKKYVNLCTTDHQFQLFYPQVLRKAISAAEAGRKISIVIAKKILNNFSIYYPS